MADEAPYFMVNGTRYPVPSDFTLGEMCDAEQHFGVEFGAKATTGFRMVAALLWIAISRADPSATVADIRALPPDVFEQAEGAADAVPPVSVAEAPAESAPSGDSSSNDSESRDGDPSRTGLPGSETFASSAPVTSPS